MRALSRQQQEALRAPAVLQMRTHAPVPTVGAFAVGHSRHPLRLSSAQATTNTAAAAPWCPMAAPATSLFGVCPRLNSRLQPLLQLTAKCRSAYLDLMMTGCA